MFVTFLRLEKQEALLSQKPRDALCLSVVSFVVSIGLQYLKRSIFFY